MSVKTEQEIEKELVKVEDYLNGAPPREAELIAHTLLWVLGLRGNSPSVYYLEK